MKSGNLTVSDARLKKAFKNLQQITNDGSTSKKIKEATEDAKLTTGTINKYYMDLNKAEVKLSTGKTVTCRVLQLFCNELILKYTPEGGSITIGCTSSKQNVILSIQDTGIGIAREHIPHLFERFYRIDEARNKKTGGTGLGLAIAQQIVKVHDAQISVTSEIDQGTSFFIFFNK